MDDINILFYKKKHPFLWVLFLFLGLITTMSVGVVFYDTLGFTEKRNLKTTNQTYNLAHTMITIAQVLANIRHSVRSFKIEYRKTDGSCSVKSGILGSTKPPSNGTVVLFDGKQPFSVYVDLIVRFDNEIVIH